MTSKNNKMMKYSVIVLLEESSEGFSQFIQTLYEIFSSKHEPFEILIMANGTEGFLKNELKNLKDCNDKLKTFTLNKKRPSRFALRQDSNRARVKLLWYVAPTAR